MKNYRYYLASLWVLLGLFVATTAFAEGDVTITEKARQHFKAGVAYVDDPSGPKYDEAYREFHKAYEESPTYKILTNIGLCALSLEKDEEAIAAYEKFLASAKSEDIPKNKRTLMERDIATLKASLVTLTLTGTPQILVLRDERLTSTGGTIMNRYDLKDGKLVLGIHPGHHRITATADGFEPQTWDFEADSASSHTHEFRLKSFGDSNAAASESGKANLAVTAPPETNPKKSTPTLVYVGAVATGVFAIGATVTGLITSSKKSDFDSMNKSPDNANKAQDLRDSGKTFALITDIGIGAAVLSAIGTAVVYFTAPSGKTETKPPVARVKVEPTVGLAQAGLSVAGQF